VTGQRFETVIVGAGQAGLAVGYHLARLGRPFVIMDAGSRIGDSWRTRWDSLRLFTPARYDGLPGMPYPAPAWSFPTKDEVADFLEAYAARFGLEVRTGLRVDRLWRESDRYVLTAGSSRFEADNVVVASGPFRLPTVPAFALKLDRAVVQLHSSAYRNPSQLQPGGVLVVGAGNSGAEIALEVARHHRTWLSGRDTGEEAPFRLGSVPDRLLTPVVWNLYSRILTVRTAAGRKLRHKGLTMGWPLVRVKPKDIAAAGIERVPRTVAVRDGSPLLEDGRTLEVANVIWCTGYRPDYSWIDLPIFDADGAPRHDRGVVADHPGLYFVGAFFLHSLTSSLLGGVGRDAAHIARQVTSQPAPRDRLKN
jgi:putative flavoprotein involved in K+ transport